MGGGSAAAVPKRPTERKCVPTASLALGFPQMKLAEWGFRWARRAVFATVRAPGRKARRTAHTVQPRHPLFEILTPRQRLDRSVVPDPQVEPDSRPIL